MKSYKIIIPFILGMSLLSNIAFAEDYKKTDNQNNKTAVVDNTKYLDATNILIFSTNHGNFGRDLSGVFGYDYGTFYPFSSIYEITQGINTSSPLYAAGLWIGGKVNGEVRVSTSEYSSEYVPGPMANGTYQTDNPDFKVYKLYYDSLEQNPNDDYLNWPVSQGAPTSFNAMINRTKDQMLWTVFNDANPAKHTTFSSTPMGIEIQQTTWEHSSALTVNAVMIMYKLYNKGSNTIDSCYISLWTDPDLGGASDDLTGCDTVQNSIFCYNADNDDYAYGSVPPAVGFKLLYGPKVPAAGSSAFFDMKFIDGYKNLDMTSSWTYIGGTDPDNALEVFGYMKGISGKDGTPYMYNGHELTYLYSGDPITSSGDLDLNPTDKRIMMSSGPFTFAPGDSQCVLIKMAVGQQFDRLNSIANMKQILDVPFNIPTDVPEQADELLPDNFSLSQNYPNPFNPTTSIHYSIPAKSIVKLDIYNILGQKIKTLVNLEQPAGNYQIEWNGTDDYGSTVSTGIYLYKLTTGEFTQTKKMMLLK